MIFKNNKNKIIKVFYNKLHIHTQDVNCKIYKSTYLYLGIYQPICRESCLLIRIDKCRKRGLFNNNRKLLQSYSSIRLVSFICLLLFTGGIQEKNLSINSPVNIAGNAVHAQ